MVETVLLSFLCKVFPLIAPLAGMDMTFYNLYEELKDSDRDKAMEYAEVFLSSADSTFTPPSDSSRCRGGAFRLLRE